MIPLALVFAVLALQVAAFMWAISSTNAAVRQAVRAESLGEDGCAAADDVLSSTLTVVRCDRDRGLLGEESRVELVVDVPVARVVDGLVPDVRVTREAFLP